MENIPEKIIGTKERNKQILDKFLKGSEKKPTLLVKKDESEKYVKKIL